LIFFEIAVSSNNFYLNVVILAITEWWECVGKT